MPTTIPQISEFKKTSFTAPIRTGHQITHDVYTRGEGKVLVLIQELPGIGQETLSLADRFVQQGYKVVLPHLFGKIGKTASAQNLVRVMCMRREFYLFAKKESSPVTDWLRALCQKVKDENQVKGVAVIGMCLTGNFGLSLLVDDAVLAGFASQPSMPIIIGQSALHMSDEDVSTIKRRLDELGPMHCGRFDKDVLCKASKFETIDQTFNQDRERVILHTLPGKGHSILTLDFDDENPGHPTQQLLREVMAYFDQALAE